MGKIKSKKFLGSSSRNNPTNLTVLCSEEDLENAGEDVWQRITQQLQSGKVLHFFNFFDLEHSLSSMYRVPRKYTKTHWFAVISI